MKRCLQVLARPLLGGNLYDKLISTLPEASLATFLRVCSFRACPVCVIPSGLDGKSWKPAIANFIAMDSKEEASIAS